MTDREAFVVWPEMGSVDGVDAPSWPGNPP